MCLPILPAALHPDPPHPAFCPTSCLLPDILTSPCPLPPEPPCPPVRRMGVSPTYLYILPCLTVVPLPRASSACCDSMLGPCA
jgi:hypothetical protein